MITSTELSTKQQLQLVLGIFVVISLIEVLNLLSGRLLNQFGLIPRYVPGLKGVLLGPLLHGSLQHYFSNIIPLCIFSYLLLQYGLKRFLLITLWLVVITGILVWLFARPATHIGASGLIYGYFAYLLVAGLLSKKFKHILISLLVAFFYGGLILGILPATPFVSWESHLFGFIAGLIAAKLWANSSPSK